MRATRFPPPLRGRDRERGGSRVPRVPLLARVNPEHRERPERQVFCIVLITVAGLVVPPSLFLPRKGGGNAVALLFAPPAFHSRQLPVGQRFHSMIMSGSPNSTGWPSSIRIWMTVPARGAGI